MPSTTIENYTKQIFLVAHETKHEVVAMGTVAEALGVVPGTATTMVKAMAKAGLANYEPRAGVSLTKSGNMLALQILRRHRLIEYFLVNTLKMDWSEIHEEAEALEHAISDRMLAKLDAFLGEPKYDPHGDPIPTQDGRLMELDLKDLSECPDNTQATIRRISDQDVAFLNFIQDSNLTPGTELTVLESNPVADRIAIKTASGKMTLGTHAAEKISVEIK